MHCMNLLKIKTLTQTYSLFFFAVVLLQDQRLDDLLDCFAILDLFLGSLCLGHVDHCAIRSLDSLEDIGDVVALSLLGGHSYFGLLLQECTHLAPFLNKNLADISILTLEKNGIDLNSLAQ